jgi:rod shape-determining protein MreC
MIATRTKTAIGVSLVIATTIALHAVGFLRPAEAVLRRGVNALSALVYRAADNPREAEPVGVCMPGGADDTALRILEEENESLRKQLGFLERQDVRAIGADVIGRDVEPIGNTLLINRGTKDGIARGQPVIVENGILIGKIARAEEDTAIIRLLSDGQSKIAATVLNRDRSIGIVEGGYGLSVRMYLIPQHEAVLPGDVVITSGLEAGMPHGLVIGTIEAVEREAYQPFQRAVLTTRAKLHRIAFVSVLLTGAGI